MYQEDSLGDNCDRSIHGHVGVMHMVKNGFSLIEVLIVVAILGILAAIAIPAVTKYVTDARRSDGKVALMEAAQIMERYFTNNYNYGEVIDGSYSGANIPNTSEQGYYALTVNAADATVFTISATPVSGGKMASDTLCATLRINHLGQRRAFNSADVETTEDCWR